MTAAEPVDVAVNPNNTDQRYVLWGNGRIDNIGGAPAITQRPDWTSWLFMPIAVALHITDWSTGQGYLLDLYGAFQTLNGAPSLGTDNVVSGVPYTNPTRMYCDWSWNPDGSGQGVVLDIYGELHPFGGAAEPPRSGPRWPVPAAKKLVMDWTPGSIKAITLDWYGGLQTDYAATPVPAGYPYWPGWDAARDLVITDWSIPRGYTLDLYGGIQPWGGAPIAYGEPYLPGADVARKLEVISAADPIRFWEVWSGGQQYDWYASTAPTVTAGGVGTVSPAATVTTTTRPTLAWAYSDPQKDSQAAWQLYVYAQAFADGHNMADPSAWAPSALVTASGVDRARRGYVADYDFENGSYRMYVRAQDTSGLWSAWSSLGWTQNVAQPATPTSLTATADEGTFSIALSVSCTTGGTATLVRLECSDDDGATWGPVRGAEAVTLAATTQAADRDIPLGIVRQYRAVAYANSPRVASAPSNIATASISTLGYVLTSTSDPTLGGRITAQEPVAWTRTAVAGMFVIVGDEYPVVVSDGTPKAKKTTLHAVSLSQGAWALLEAVAESSSTLLLRDPYGRATYCRLVGDWAATWLKGGSVDPGYAYTTDLPLVEVAAPTLLDVASTLPPGPAG